MFSIHKNYIKEQQKLINKLQEQIINQNIKFNKLQSKNEIQNKLIPFFKQIAQIYSFYCSDSNCAVGGNEGANLMLSILDYCCYDDDEIDDLIISGVEEKIRQWEVSIIEKKRIQSQRESSNDNLEFITEKANAEIELNNMFSNAGIGASESAKQVIENEIGSITDLNKNVEDILNDIPSAKNRLTEDKNKESEVNVITNDANKKAPLEKVALEKTLEKKKVVEDFGGLVLVDEEE
ncbi:MAG: hypothetical protein OEV44_07715 [Spirochaetota bacterium]|nr:hypothetical protein [Spirochaetota bacterium]